MDPVSSRVYHLEKRPSEGRNVLVDTENNTDLFGVNWNARSGVHEYGGAAATVHNGVAYFSHWVDGRVYMVKGQETPKPVTPSNRRPFITQFHYLTTGFFIREHKLPIRQSRSSSRSNASSYGSPRGSHHTRPGWYCKLHLSYRHSFRKCEKDDSWR